jgi:hypothetical protein
VLACKARQWFSPSCPSAQMLVGGVGGAVTIRLRFKPSPGSFFLTTTCNAGPSRQTLAETYAQIVLDNMTRTGVP